MIITECMKMEEKMKEMLKECMNVIEEGDKLNNFYFLTNQI